MAEVDRYYKKDQGKEEGPKETDSTKIEDKVKKYWEESSSEDDVLS